MARNQTIQDIIRKLSTSDLREMHTIMASTVTAIGQVAVKEAIQAKTTISAREAMITIVDMQPMIEKGLKGDELTQVRQGFSAMIKAIGDVV